MSKVAIVTDSVACLTRHMAYDYSIHVVPVNIVFEGKVYRDWVDLTPSDAYRMLEKDPRRFTTSAASPVEYAAIFRPLCAEYQAILCIAVSSRLSTMHNTAQLAAEQMKTEYPNVSIEVLDSMTATAAEGFIALAAAREARQGKELAEVSRAAREVRDKVSAVVVLETISHVYRTGRVPKIASQIGALLNVKPIVTISDGAVHFLSASRTKQQAVEKMVAHVQRSVAGRPAHMAVMHADCAAEGQQLRDRVEAEFNCVELWLTEFSPVMAYGTGPGVLAIAYYCDN
ncbi:MAG: DegV family protein [Chloroflexi bacterium]|nr:DegV family protein [Chloroflexota bacterium]